MCHPSTQYVSPQHTACVTPAHSMSHPSTCQPAVWCRLVFTATSLSFNTIAQPAIRTSSSSGQRVPAVKRPEHEADHTVFVCATYSFSAYVRCGAVHLPNAALTDALPTCNICSLDVIPCVSALLGKGGQLHLKALRSFQTPTQRFKLQQQVHPHHSDDRKSRTSDTLTATFCMQTHRHPLHAFHELQRSAPQLLATALLYSELGLWIHGSPGMHKSYVGWRYYM
jgi:hypothetical protein